MPAGDLKTLSLKFFVWLKSLTSIGLGALGVFANLFRDFKSGTSWLYALSRAKWFIMLWLRLVGWWVGYAASAANLIFGSAAAIDSIFFYSFEPGDPYIRL